MTFLDILNEASEISEAAYIKFLQRYKADEKSIHLFFEGSEDQSFYSVYIDQIYGDVISHYYVCNGKMNVYQNYLDINWATYSKSRTLFFVDKDLDDLIGIDRPVDENIYTTKFYSVENYLVAPEVLKRMLSEYCYLNDTHILDDLTGRFEAQKIRFAGLVLPLSSWVLYCRRNSLSLNLNDINLSKLFFVDSDLVVRRFPSKSGNSGFQYVCASTKTNHFSFIDIKREAELLVQIQDFKIYLRGKFELWFLHSFFERVTHDLIPQINAKIKEYNKRSSAKRPKCKVMVNITPENTLLLASPKLRIPEDLRLFLMGNFMKFSAS